MWCKLTFARCNWVQITGLHKGDVDINRQMCLIGNRFSRNSSTHTQSWNLIIHISVDWTSDAGPQRLASINATLVELRTWTQRKVKWKFGIAAVQWSCARLKLKLRRQNNHPKSRGKDALVKSGSYWWTVAEWRWQRLVSMHLFYSFAATRTSKLQFRFKRRAALMHFSNSRAVVATHSQSYQW